MPRHQNQANFDPHTKTKYISTHTLKSSQILPLTKPSQFRSKH